MKPEDKFDKDFDLEASEFRKDAEPEPFFGWGAPDWSVLVIQIGIVIYIAKWFHWVMDVTIEQYGTWIGLAIFGVIASAAIFAIKLIGDLIIFLVSVLLPPRPPQ